MPELTVTILAGLPGSGKTTYFKQGRSGLNSNCCFDNFHENSLDDSPTFTESRFYPALREQLRRGKDCLISDIEYCQTERRLDAERAITALAGELGITIKIVKVWFENNPEACRRNVVRRYWGDPTRNYVEELKNIDKLSRGYECPSEGAMPVQTYSTVEALASILQRIVDSQFLVP